MYSPDSKPKGTTTSQKSSELKQDSKMPLSCPEQIAQTWKMAIEMLKSSLPNSICPDIPGEERPSGNIVTYSVRVQSMEMPGTDAWDINCCWVAISEGRFTWILHQRIQEEKVKSTFQTCSLCSARFLALTTSCLPSMPSSRPLSCFHTKWIKVGNHEPQEGSSNQRIFEAYFCLAGYCYFAGLFLRTVRKYPLKQASNEHYQGCFLPRRVIFAL